MTHRIYFLFLVVTLALVTPAPLRAWQWNEKPLKRVSLPTTFRVVRVETSADLDADGVEERLTLRDGRVTVQTESRTRWQSPQVWSVAQAQIADLNRDGLPEAVLLVWRRFKPWPVDAWLPNGGRIDSFHDSNGMSCHLILIGWKQDAFRELWAGSALAEPVREFATLDLIGHGEQYLITLEGQYDDRSFAPSRALAIWEWNGFGFTLVSKLEDSFSLMVPAVTEDGRALILTD